MYYANDNTEDNRPPIIRLKDFIAANNFTRYAVYLQSGKKLIGDILGIDEKNEKILLSESQGWHKVKNIFSIRCLVWTGRKLI